MTEAEAQEHTTEDGWKALYWLAENSGALNFRIADESDGRDEYSFEGFVTYSGCINFRTPDTDFAHLCAAGEVAKLGRAFEMLIDAAAVTIPGWCGESDDQAPHIGPSGSG